MSVADKGQAHVQDDVDPTKTKTESPAAIRPRGKENIPRNPVPSIFEEKLREIDPAISETDTKKTDLPFPDHAPDCEANKEGGVDFKKLNVKEDLLNEAVDYWAGPKLNVDKAVMDLDLSVPTLNNTSMGQALNPTHKLFAIGSYRKKPSGGSSVREVTDTAQKKKKQ